MQIKTGNDTGKQEKLDFNQLWLRYVVYWPYFLVLLILAIAGAWLYLHLSPHYYEATARILIKDETKGAEDTKGIEFMNIINTAKIVENESEVIASKTLIYSVVKELGLYAQLYTEGQFRPMPAYTSSPVKIEAMHPDSLTESDKVFYRFDKQRQEVIISNVAYPLDTWVSIGGDSLRFLRNPNYDGRQYKNYYYTLVHPATIGWAIKDHLEVTAISKSSTILELVLQDEVPKRAEDILNELMRVYNISTVSNKNTLAANTLYFVEGRLKHVQQELDSIERRIQAYKEHTGAIDISTEGGLFLKNVSDNDQRISEINMQLAVLDQIESYVQAKNNKASIVPSTLGIDDHILSNLLNLLYNAELEYEKLKTTEGPNSPALVAINSQIAKIRPSILENIGSQRKTLEARKANLQTTNEGYTSSIRTIPQREKELVDIDRQRTIVGGIYTYLLEKQEDLTLSHAASIPGATIVDHAEASGYPVSPKSKKVYLLAFAIPIVAGIGIITLKETFNSKVLFRYEIENMTSYPVIGEIVHNKSMAPIVTGKMERTFIAEQFRALRVSLTLNKSKSDFKKILVTSTIAGEGKSFIALNLAFTFALTGKRVILLELDINNPNICNKLKIESSPGIADYLQGKCSLESIIKQYDDPGNLFVMPAGRYPEKHFSELLETGSIQELINHLGNIFDYVIIDIAPVGSITDAYVLSACCDKTLYVVRHKYTPKIFVQRLDQNDQLINIAVVFNDIRARGFGKYHFGYGYGYGYVYNDKTRKSEPADL
jgi:capsular exopolysaccharide synthesis family protein